jgi:hypothetical protein
LSIELSRSFPTVDIEVSDDSVIELVLYAEGAEQDRFANGVMPFFWFQSRRQARKVRGSPKTWARWIGDAIDRKALSKAFDQSARVYDILRSTSTAVGWDESLVGCGWPKGYRRRRFVELHFTCNRGAGEVVSRVAQELGGVEISSSGWPIIPNLIERLDLELVDEQVGNVVYRHLMWPVIRGRSGSVVMFDPISEHYTVVKDALLVSWHGGPTYAVEAMCADS